MNGDALSLAIKTYLTNIIKPTLMHVTDGQSHHDTFVSISVLYFSPHASQNLIWHSICNQDQILN